MKVLLISLALILSVITLAENTNPPENQVLVSGTCKDYLVHGHFMYSIQVTGEDSSLDKLNKTLGKDFDKLIWRLKRSRLKGLEYKIVQSDMQQVGNQYKGVKSVDVYLPQNQKLSDIDKIVNKTHAATISQAQSVLTESAKKSVINRCISKATAEAKTKAKQVAKSLKVKLQKKPLNIHVEEEVINSNNSTSNGNTIQRKKLLVTVTIGFKVK